MCQSSVMKMCHLRVRESVYKPFSLNQSLKMIHADEEKRMITYDASDGNP